MKAAVIEEIGTNPVVRELPDPEPAEGFEVVDVATAALNPIDQHFASGRYPGAPAPHVVGREGIATLADGRRVYFAAQPFPQGSVAERALVKPAAAFDVPEGLDDGQALAIGAAGLAAWLTLTYQAGLREGESVLVLGASGAVGQIAVQAAKLLGAARVVGAARDSAAAESVNGIDAVVSLSGGNSGEDLRAAAEGGFDVVIDPLGGEYLAAAVTATATGARLVNLGNGAGAEVTLDVRALQGRKLIGHSAKFVDGAAKKEAYAAMAQRMLAGELKLAVEEFGIDDVAAAWARQEEGPHGKVVIGV